MTCHRNCCKGVREANVNTDQFEWYAGGISKEVVYVFRRHEKSTSQSSKKGEGGGHEKVGFIKSNGSSSYLLI